MTKRVIIPDMHCNIEWVKNILKRESPDIVIMLGDYFDSFDPNLYNNSPNSFKELLKIKKDFIKEHGKNSFITLLGNHDFHYLYDVLEQYSGFSWRLSGEISPLINPEFEKHDLQKDKMELRFRACVPNQISVFLLQARASNN